MSRLVICKVEDLPEGMPRSFEVEDVPIVVARSGTAVFALENRCSHDDGVLSDGWVIGHDTPKESETQKSATQKSATQDGALQVECARHGGRFDFATGQATRMPAVASIEAFPAGVEGNDVWVEVPEDF